METSTIKQNVESINNMISKSLKESIDRDNPDEIKGKIVELTNLFSSSCRAVAESEMLYNINLGELAENEAYTKLSATDRKMIFGGKLAKEIALMTYSERLNKAITHAIDGYRSVLSFNKSEMDLTKNI